jgi:hypothetical protein
MKKRITHIVPLRAGLVIGILNGITKVIFAAIALTVAARMPQLGEQSSHDYMFMFLWGPATHAGIGFAFGLIGAVVYNFAAKWTGGFEVELQDTPPER